MRSSLSNRGEKKTDFQSGNKMRMSGKTTKQNLTKDKWNWHKVNMQARIMWDKKNGLRQSWMYVTIDHVDNWDVYSLKFGTIMVYTDSI